jgi:hypothetical protein
VSRLRYESPPTFETGQVLGRANLGILRDNDDFFRGLADRYRCIPYGASRSWIGDETEQVVWDGYHYLEADALTLYYHLTLAGRDTAGHAHLYYNWDGDVGSPGGTLIATISSNGTSSSSYDLSTFHGTNGDGLYRVGCVMHRDADGEDENLNTTCRAPYTVYTGAKSYSTPPTITDGNAGTAAHLNTLRNNDLFFNDCTPRQPGFVGMERSYLASEHSLILWDGWIKHRSTEMYWYIGMVPGDGDNNADSNQITIKYDLDGTPETVKTHTTNGTSESHATLAGSYTIGNWYRVQVEQTRSSHASGYNCTGSVYYLYMAPPQDSEGETAFTLMDEFTENQWVYGDTAGQDTRLELLSDNDTYIIERLCWDDDEVGRLDFAVSKPAFIRLGGTDTGDYRLQRRGNTLYYRGTELTLRWGTDNNEGLDDAADCSTFDLNSIDLPHGTIYRVTGTTLEYAMEK